MKTRESEEMYLETILLLKKEKGNVRSLDIVGQLNYSKASVSRAVNLLRNKGYITVDGAGGINFTQDGERRAKEIYERHSILTAYLMNIGASKEIAEENACRIEHIISPELFDIIKEKVKQ